MPSDPCDLPQDTTDLLTGAVTSPPPVTDPDKSVDCFFVYGTATHSLTPNAERVASPEIRAATSLQGARFNRICRMYAPVYRQASFPGTLLVNLGYTEPFSVAYRDVLDAWNAFLSHQDTGRGVILIGHSQGAFLLRKLIREQIDPRPQVRSRLAGAFVMGGNVTTERGSTVGGDFTRIPICTQRYQYRCVTAYSNNIVPPPLSLFGNSTLDIASLRAGLPMGPRYAVACTDPAVISGNDDPVGITVPSAPYPTGILAAFVAYTAAPGAWPTSSTTWTTGRGRGVGRCAEVNGYRQYHITMTRPQALNEIPLFDTHVIDVNFGLDRLVDIASRQAKSWLADTH
ncbi:DUF3089 domain-containing protein [Gordonia sp. OPL2]|uniref:DUF3089 domain-containing protein n=1 Tax=Gordonia sp. OPL2 TaxID=2486274 RepID=UPI0021CD12AB|nr:DUF3089 domain-containing protein [Gordonia sp. OPL2]